jgi:hypothetical protein
MAKFDPKDVLNFVFVAIGQGDSPPDEKLIEAADACFGAAVALLWIVSRDELRERALAERDARSADLIRQMNVALTAIEHGEIVPEYRLKN